MKRIYVAGPYTAANSRLTKLNVDKAISVGCKLIRKGYAPFIPHLSHYIWMHPDGDFDYQLWTKLDMEWLKVCDAFYYMDSSPGADKELEKAREMGIPIYTKIEDVPNIDT